MTFHVNLLCQFVQARADSRESESPDDVYVRDGSAPFAKTVLGNKCSLENSRNDILLRSLNVGWESAKRKLTALVPIR